jgi:hypothetical protein
MIAPSSTPTNTLIPTQTPTITRTSTPIPTNTVTPTEISVFSETTTPLPLTQLEQLSDSSWKYIDHEAGYKLNLGPNWYLEDVSNLNIIQILERTNRLRSELGISSTPQFAVEPEGMRILGIYLDETIPDYMSSSFATAFIIDKNFAKMSIEEVNNRVIDILIEGYGLDSNSIDNEIITNQHNVSIGVAFYNIGLNYFHMRIFFKVEDGIGMIVFGFSDQNVDIFGPEWSLLTSSLQYIKD